eukprot:239941-Prorocentrum_minimum.AAC.1
MALPNLFLIWLQLVVVWKQVQSFSDGDQARDRIELQQLTYSWLYPVNAGGAVYECTSHQQCTHKCFAVARLRGESLAR